MSKTVSLADLLANADALLDEVTEKQEEVVVTREGRAAVRVLPMVDEMRGPMYGTIRFMGDIVSPVDDWDADR